MKIGLFTVFDSAANAYLPPFNAITPAMAQRIFMEAANDPQHKFNRYASDYTLFEIGTFDDHTGHIDHKVPLNMGNALSYNDQAQHPTDEFGHPVRDFPTEAQLAYIPMTSEEDMASINRKKEVN